MHRLANQELARLRYAEALRNATRHAGPVEVVELPEPRPYVLLTRARFAIGNLVAQAPALRVSVR